MKFRSDMVVELIDHMGSDETIARAARVSTGKDQLDQGRIEGLIGYLVREGHTSTLEHCTVTIRLNAPIFVHRQIMTHRTMSKNSESGRYTELKPDFYVPSEERPLVNAGKPAHPELVAGTDLQFDFMRHEHEIVYDIAWSSYQDMLRQGIAEEVARNVLPVGIYTSVYVTANLLGWFNFLRLRNGSNGHPQWEIADTALQVEAIIADLYPIAYQAWKQANG